MCYHNKWQEGSYKPLLPGSTKAGEVMQMSDFELLSIMLTFIGLLLAALTLGKSNQ